MRLSTPDSLRTIWAESGRVQTRTALVRPDLTAAAVLVPVVFTAGLPQLLLTQRTELVETHKGQIAFPGGIIDAGDRSAVDAALRETEEELGIKRSHVQPLGELDDHATPTGFVITPVVGILSEGFLLHINPDEVADVFFVPLAFFLQPAAAEAGFREVHGIRRQFWMYRYEGREIWGATAAIIKNLTDILVPER